MNDPGYLQLVGTEGLSTLRYYKALCWACKDEHLVLDYARYPDAANHLLLHHRWHIFKGKWCCSACSTFLRSLPTYIDTLTDPS